MKFKSIIGALAALAVSATVATAQDAVTFRLNWYMGGLHVPFYYGKEKGFYKEEGIDLTINEGPRLGQHRAGGRGGLRHVRTGGFVQRDRDCREGRRRSNRS